MSRYKIDEFKLNYQLKVEEEKNGTAKSGCIFNLIALSDQL